MGLAVIVLAGGESRRFGSDKLVAVLDDRTLLDHALDGIPAGAMVAVVGPERPLSRAVTFLREDPPGGGPAAGLITGLQWALDQRATMIATLPGDAPAGGRAALRLVRALASVGPSPRSPSADGEGGTAAAYEHRLPSTDGEHGTPEPAERRNPTQVGRRDTEGPTEPQDPTYVGKREPNPGHDAADPDPDPGPEVVVAVDAEGREQVLQLALRPSIAQALIELAGPGAGHGESVRRLLHRLDPHPRQVELSADLTSDIDTTAQLRARG